LQNSSIYATCPNEQDEFRLSETLLFDGTKPFPKKALDIQQALKKKLEERKKQLQKKKKLITKKAAITTETVNIGKNLEKILPTMKDFKWRVPDCKFLGDPIDLIIFKGLSVSRID